MPVPSKPSHPPAKVVNPPQDPSPTYVWSSEERAIDKGEISIFYHLEFVAKVVEESDSEVVASAVSIENSCLSFGVNGHHQQVWKFNDVFEAKIDAHKVFDKMSEPVLLPMVISGSSVRWSRTKELKEYDFIRFVFDPGGENQKLEVVEPNKFLPWFDHIPTGSVIGKNRNVCVEMLKTADKFCSKFDGLLLQFESLRHIVFDPGGRNEGKVRVEVGGKLGLMWESCYQLVLRSCIVCII